MATRGYAQTNIFPATGNVGVGTASPTSKLDVLPANANAISIRPYGTGVNQTGQLQFKELVAKGTNYVALRAPDSLSANYIFRLPANYGTNGQLLTTNGSGVLSWSTVSASGGAATALNNLIATSINQSLRPNTNNTRDIGSNTLGWKDIYMTGKLYMGSTVFLKNTGGTSLGLGAGNISTGLYNVFIGNSAGFVNSSGISNVFVGAESGSNTTTGSENTFIGDLAGYGNTTGNSNTIIGAGADLLSGSFTNATAIGTGALAGASNSFILGNNVNVGAGTSVPEARMHIKTNSSVSYSQVLIDEDESDFARLSFRNAGSANVWSIAGYNTSTSNLGRLNFYNSAIGDVMSLTGDGNVCIGTATPATGYKLSVNGKGMFTELKVQTRNSWPDYVFNSSYELLPLPQLDEFIKQNKHLPGIPSASDIAADNGFEIGAMQSAVVQKIEELTLYVLQQQALIDALKEENKAIKATIESLKK